MSNQSLNSGFINPPLADISNTFTDLKILHRSDTNIVIRARRYGRMWILKGLNPEVRDNTTALVRLRKEFEILMELQHPGLCLVSAIEEIPEYGPCIVMEYIDGPTLDRWLDSSPSLKQRREVASRLVDTLEYMHSKGVVHRDIKPANIIVAANGERVVLIDFGLAHTDSHTVLKNPAGTPGYISQEQMTDAVADIRNDIYSLGKVLEDLKINRPDIIKKCLLPADKRYQNVRELKSDMNRRGIGLKINLLILLVIVVVFFIFLLLGRLMDSSQTDKHDEASPTQQQKDSTSVAASVIKTDSIVSDKIGVDISGITDGNATSDSDVGRKAVATAEDKVEFATKEGISQLDQRWNAYAWWRHLDTLSNIRYLNELLEYYDKDIVDFPKRFTDALGKNQFTNEELATIRKNLETRESEWQQKINQKLLNLRRK